MLVIEDKLL